MKTLLLILSLLLVSADPHQMHEQGVSSVTSSGVIFHIGHPLFIDDDQDGDDLETPHSVAFFPQPPAPFHPFAACHSEPRQPLLSGNPIRAPPLTLT